MSKHAPKRYWRPPSSKRRRSHQSLMRSAKASTVSRMFSRETKRSRKVSSPKSRHTLSVTIRSRPLPGRPPQDGMRSTPSKRRSVHLACRLTESGATQKQIGQTWWKARRTFFIPSASSALWRGTRTCLASNRRPRRAVGEPSSVPSSPHRRPPRDPNRSSRFQASRLGF